MRRILEKPAPDILQSAPVLQFQIPKRLLSKKGKVTR